MVRQGHNNPPTPKHVVTLEAQPTNPSELCVNFVVALAGVRVVVVVVVVVVGSVGNYVHTHYVSHLALHQQTVVVVIF